MHWFLIARASLEFSRVRGLVVVVHGLSDLLARGICLDQGSKPRLPHWQVGSLPLSHQGSRYTRSLAKKEEWRLQVYFSRPSCPHIPQQGVKNETFDLMLFPLLTHLPNADHPRNCACWSGVILTRRQRDRCYQGLELLKRHRGGPCGGVDRPQKVWRSSLACLDCYYQPRRTSKLSKTNKTIRCVFRKAA